MTILEFLSQIHRDCDVHFAATERALSQNDFEKARASFERFTSETLKHFSVEEKVLFPEIEVYTGEGGGPTFVMMHEHEQMREILNDMKASLEKSNRSDYQAAADTLMILLQQHNMKEEQILYPMADQFLADDRDRVINEMRTI